MMMIIVLLYSDDDEQFSRSERETQRKCFAKEKEISISSTVVALFLHVIERRLNLSTKNEKKKHNSPNFSDTFVVR